MLDPAAVRLTNLALLLQATNRLADAEPLYRRALAINEKSNGPDHPIVAKSLNNLGILRWEAGRPEANDSFRQAELRQRALVTTARHVPHYRRELARQTEKPLILLGNGVERSHFEAPRAVPAELAAHTDPEVRAFLEAGAA